MSKSVNESNFRFQLTKSSFSVRLGDELFVSTPFTLEFDDDTLLMPIGCCEFELKGEFSYFVICSGERGITGDVVRFDVPLAAFPLTLRTKKN